MVERAVALDPAADHSLAVMAARANFSVRHLTRLFDEHVGMSAASYVERVRLEAASVMLEGGDESLELVGKRTGFGSVETMRRAFLRDFGVSPAATEPSSAPPASPTTEAATARIREVEDSPPHSRLASGLMRALSKLADDRCPDGGLDNEQVDCPRPAPLS